MEPTEINASLRNEIVESQKTQADLLKWKLIAIAAVSSISLGFTGADTGGKKADPFVLKLLLCTIPLICAYIDFLSLHVMIRIVTLGTYLKNIGSDYEAFVSLTRQRGVNPFIFETVALHGSSVVFNLLLIILGACLPKEWPTREYLFSGILGTLSTLGAWILYHRRAERVRNLGGRVAVRTATAPGLRGTGQDQGKDKGPA
jgi:hypothetical protein